MGTGELEELRCRQAVMSVESLAEAGRKLPRQRLEEQEQAVALALLQLWVELAAMM